MDYMLHNTETTFNNRPCLLTLLAMYSLIDPICSGDGVIVFGTVSCMQQSRSEFKELL